MRETTLRTKLVSATLVILCLITGIVYSHHPTAGNYLIAAIMLLSAVDVELFYRHERHNRSWEFEGLFLLPSGTWALFFIVAASYLLLGGDRRIPLFTNGGLPSNPSDRLVISLGRTNFAMGGGLLDAIREGKPTPIFTQQTTAGQEINPPILLYIQKDRFYCDFDMLAGQTTSPIVVRHNQLTKPLPSGWMSNNNDVALEVVNQDENPIFQMYYDGPDKIVINGIFVMPGWVFLVGGPPAGGFFMIPMKAPNLAALLRAFKLNRLFKYPHAVFPGVPN